MSVKKSLLDLTPQSPLKTYVDCEITGWMETIRRDDKENLLPNILPQYIPKNCEKRASLKKHKNKEKANTKNIYNFTQPKESSKRKMLNDLYKDNNSSFTYNEVLHPHKISCGTELSSVKHEITNRWHCRPLIKPTLKLYENILRPTSLNHTSHLNLKEIRNSLQVSKGRNMRIYHCQSQLS